MSALVAFEIIHVYLCETMCVMNLKQQQLV